MSIHPYQHKHNGIEEITWSRLGPTLVALAETIAGDWRPELVVGIAKGGMIPGPRKLLQAFQQEVVQPGGAGAV